MECDKACDNINVYKRNVHPKTFPHLPKEPRFTSSGLMDRGSFCIFRNSLTC